ncbi:MULTISPECIES: Hsp70 family protein [Streptacidiphilus]|uniref:Hsp70 family protein n=1 Tax=Streptacidiphilus cavernicola TaxID=3342716 RepID=A0ABV6UE16_9ACTN|nr:Hsp70 family protein [Streptacidiphilus jeojiense]
MAVIVGCSYYEDEDIANLRFAHLDAMRVGDAFTASVDVAPEAVLTFADGLPPGQLPTRHNVIRTLSALAKSSGAQIDRLFFFFSGHGFHSSSDGSDYLITRDSITSELEHTSLEFELLARMLRATGAKHVVLLLDACRTPLGGGKTFGAPAKVHVERLCPPGMVSFCSCAPESTSYESARLQSGIFSEALCRALSDEGRCVTVADLDSYLTHCVPKLAREFEKPTQQPYSRVEPLALAELEIVSPRKRNEWRASASVGQELRQRSVSRAVNAVIPDRALFAIDFGTTNSVIAVADDDSKVHFIPAGDGRRLVPSVITFVSDLDYLVGSRAVDLDRYSPGRTARSVKRRLGTGYAFQLDGKELSAELLSSLVIRSLRTNAEDVLGRLPAEAMIAYPANFSISQANSLLRAFELTGLRVHRMVGEPNIACVLLHLDRPEWEGVALVVDLGGGTLDVAVAEVGDNVHEIISVFGDNHLGGLDFDIALAEVFKERLLAWNPAVALDSELEARILREAERTKEVLTDHETAVASLQNIEVGPQVLTFSLTVDRSEFREVCRGLTERFAKIVRTAMDDSDRGPVGVVLLSGQGGKIFTVREALEDMLDGVEFVTAYQDFAVAYGLALYSSLLAGARSAREGAVPLLLDLSHRGIGVVCSDATAPSHKAPDQATYLERRVRKAPDSHARTHVVLERLTTIPTKRSDWFRFVGGPGEEVVIPVIEKSKTADEDVEIGTVRFPATQEAVDVEITVEVDANSAILLLVADWTNLTYRRFQLNQYYRNPNWVMHNALDLLLDGWAVYDVEPMDPAFRSSEVVGRAPTTLRDLNIPEEIATIDRRLEQDVAGWRRSDTYIAGVGAARFTALQRKARLLLASEQREEGARTLAEAIRLNLSSARDSVQWVVLAQAVRVAERELTNDPAMHLVRTALAQICDLREVTRTFARDAHVPEAITALERIGATREARHLTGLIAQ